MAGKDEFEAKEIASTARGDSEGDLNVDPKPGSESLIGQQSLQAKKPIKTKKLQVQKTSREPRDHRNVNGFELGKRKELAEKPKVILRWMHNAQKPDDPRVVNNLEKENSPAPESIISKKLGLRGIKIKPLANNKVSSHQVAEKASPLVENRSVKYKQYTANDKKVLVKAEKLVSYWRDTSRQTPIVFKEISLVKDESQKTVFCIDLSKRKILVNGEPYTARPTSRDKRKKRSAKKQRQARKNTPAN